MSRIKLLIINESLNQGGSEKWIYEICRTIDKEKFEVMILTSKAYLSADTSINFKNYYYYKLKDLGIEIYEFIEFYGKLTPLKFTLYRVRRLIRHLLGQTKTVLSKELKKLLQTSDVICVIDYHNYIYLKEVIHNHLFFITLHCHKAQFTNDPYVIFDKSRTYNFTYFCPKQIEEIGGSGLDIVKNNFFFSPLVLDLSNCENLFNPISDNPIIISIFTRIAYTKRIDSLIEAFAEIKRKFSGRVVLNIYGKIVDSSYHQHLLNLANSLNIESDSLRFLGHTENITDTIRNDRVNVYWGLSVNSSFGYSSIEIGAMGIPCFFWNLDPTTDFTSILEDTGNLIFTHNKVSDFVDSNLKYISSNELLGELSNRQRKFFLERHDIASRINDFEEYVISLATNFVNKET